MYQEDNDNIIITVWISDTEYVNATVVGAILIKGNKLLKQAEF